MARSPLPDATAFVAHINSILRYDPDTGSFFWRVDRRSHGGKAKAGTEAGWPERNGYRYIRLQGRTFPLHRIAWLIIHRQWNEGEIDHVNGDKADNRLTNLRQATRRQNLANRPAQANSILGIRGVSPTPEGRFAARINRRLIGHYDTAEDAVAAYRKAAEAVFGQYAHHISRAA